MSLFKQKQRIIHEHGYPYVIEKIPDNRKLESCNEPFYEYRSISTDEIWIICQSEMEDGRFTAM